MTYLLIGIGGFLGAGLRYLLSIIMFSETVIFPFATLTVNLVGCFLLAFLVAITKHKMTLPSRLKAAITTGFLGSFTTFSALSVETYTLFTEDYILYGFIYLTVSYFGGILMVHFGFLFNGESEKV